VLSAQQTIIKGTQSQASAFNRGLDNPRSAQESVLKTLLSANANSEVGKQFQFDRLSSPTQYQQHVPAHNYADMVALIARIASGEKNVSYCDTTLAFEQTSGSTGASKLIPITSASMVSIQNGIFPWLHDLVVNYPAVTRGSMYWSISPNFRDPQSTSAGIPIGLASDLDYFGPALGAEIARHAILLDQQFDNTQYQHWRVLTARALLMAENLTFISIWSPTFILALFDYMKKYAEPLIQFVKTGVARGFEIPISARFDPDPGRAQAIAAGLSAVKVSVTSLWPYFNVLSCWTHGSAAHYVDELLHYFSSAHIQPKGLIATEGIMSVPLSGVPDPVLAVNSGFFEFEDEQGRVLLCDEVNIGQAYKLIVTMPNGLYRYDTGDLVNVTGYYRQTPTLRFLGRTSSTSDLCGEKLTDAFVTSIINDVTGFSLLTPKLDPKPHYRIYLDKQHYDAGAARNLIMMLDNRLHQNPQYALARRLGQLEPLRFTLLERPMEKYTAVEMARGQCLGNIKPPVLRTELDWDLHLCNR